MSMTIWLNQRIGDKHTSDGEDRSALFALHEQLDRVAAQQSIAPISSFFDETDLRYNMDDDDFDESEEDLDDGEQGWPASAANWHDPQQVLAVVQALSAYLAQHPIELPKGGWSQEDLLADLQSLVPGLEAAISAKNSVHLLVVM